MNAASALTAVDPTYILPVIKALKEAAMSKGLSESDAQFATAQTVHGTGQLVRETREDPDALKLMIGTRTLKEEEARAIFVAAFDSRSRRSPRARRSCVNEVSVETAMNPFGGIRSDQ